MYSLLGALLALTLTVTSALQAQDSVIVIDPDAPAVTPTAGRTLPSDVLDEAVQRFNDSTTIRFISDIDVPVGAVLLSPVALFRGTLRIGGTIEGPITVVNGDVVIQAGGLVSGDILVDEDSPRKGPRCMFPDLMAGIKLGLESIVDGRDQVAAVDLPPEPFQALASRDELGLGKGRG